MPRVKAERSKHLRDHKRTHGDNMRYLLGLFLLQVCLAYNYDRYINSGLDWRSHTEVITVYNGGEWGSWKTARFCPSNTFAVGYSMKLEDNQGNRDDTALNNIALFCAPASNYRRSQVIASEDRGWGDWTQPYMCPRNTYLSSFSLQVEEYQGRGDDTAANYVRFTCRGQTEDRGDLLHRGRGRWGRFGRWSTECASGDAVCGMRVKFENHVDGDDTALNDVEFYCCSI